MSTLGYGDIVPKNENEKTFVTFMAFTASMLFGYTINCMGIIFSDMNNRKYAYEKKFTEINRFFKDHNVELGLQIRA